MEEIKIFCSYGCGREAITKLKNGKYCCELSITKCPALRELNKKGNTGRIHSEESKQKISSSNKGKTKEKPIRIDNDENILCSYGCGEIAKYKYKSGKVCCSDLQYRCPNQREKNKNRLIEQFKNQERRNKQKIAATESWKNPLRALKNIIGLKNFYNNETELQKSIRCEKCKILFNTKEIKNKRIQSAKEFWKREDYRIKHAQAMKNVFQNPDYIKKLSKNIKEFYINNPDKCPKGPKNPMYNKIHKNSSKILMREKGIKRWKDPVFCEKMSVSLNIKPNKPEILLIELFKNLELNYEYTGNYTFWLNGKNPDFVDKNLKKIIEFFGIYWHGEEITGTLKDEHEQSRINHFKENGYECLVIWENELSNIDDVINKIISFTNL